jgi:omega-6 fatty acid desaturase (delta-12 desaturase)
VLHLNDGSPAGSLLLQQEASGPPRNAFELKPFTESSNGIATWQVLNTLVPYGLLWALALKLLESRSWLLAPVLVLQVLFLARCFSLMHDCGHQSLFRHRSANRWVGFLLGVVSGIPQLPWARGHDFHHRHNGDWEKYQGPSALVSQQVYRAMPPGQQRLYRWLRHPLMLFPGGFFYLVIKPRLALILGLLEWMPAAIGRLQSDPGLPLATLVAEHRSRHWHSPEEFRDLLANNLAVLALWTTMAATVGAGAFWTVYVPVMTCGAAIFLCIFFVQHNFPGSYAHRTEGWSAMRGVLAGTSDLDLPGVLHWFSADIGCHAIHHLCAAVPNYRLRACHDRNAHLLEGVHRLTLADFPACFSYILWDPQVAQLTSIHGIQP